LRILTCDVTLRFVVSVDAPSALEKVCITNNDSVQFAADVGTPQEHITIRTPLTIISACSHDFRTNRREDHPRDNDDYSDQVIIDQYYFHHL